MGGWRPTGPDASGSDSGMSLSLVMKPLYRAIHVASKFVFFVAVRQGVLGRERVPDRGAVILAISHLSHTDPIALGASIERPVDFMARSEGFSTPLKARLMKSMGAFEIERFGWARPGLVEGQRRLEAGRMIGVFPEGEVMTGSESVLCGAPIKCGAAWLSRRTGAPIIPCVVLGSKSLHSPKGWLPFKLGRSWVAFGEPIQPNLEVSDSRAGRRALTDKVAVALRDLHVDLVRECAVPPTFAEA